MGNFLSVSNSGPVTSPARNIASDATTSLDIFLKEQSFKCAPSEVADVIQWPNILLEKLNLRKCIKWEACRSQVSVGPPLPREGDAKLFEHEGFAVGQVEVSADGVYPSILRWAIDLLPRSTGDGDRLASHTDSSATRAGSSGRQAELAGSCSRMSSPVFMLAMGPDGLQTLWRFHWLLSDTSSSTVAVSFYLEYLGCATGEETETAAVVTSLRAVKCCWSVRINGLDDESQPGCVLEHVHREGDTFWGLQSCITVQKSTGPCQPTCDTHTRATPAIPTDVRHTFPHSSLLPPCITVWVAVHSIAQVADEKVPAGSARSSEAIMLRIEPSGSIGSTDDSTFGSPADTVLGGNGVDWSKPATADTDGTFMAGNGTKYKTSDGTRTHTNSGGRDDSSDLQNSDLHQLRSTAGADTCQDTAMDADPEGLSHLAVQAQHHGSRSANGIHPKSGNQVYTDRTEAVSTAAAEGSDAGKQRTCVSSMQTPAMSMLRHNDAGHVTAALMPPAASRSIYHSGTMHQPPAANVHGYDSSSPTLPAVVSQVAPRNNLQYGSMHQPPAVSTLGYHHSTSTAPAVVPQASQWNILQYGAKHQLSAASTIGDGSYAQSKGAGARKPAARNMFQGGGLHQPPITRGREAPSDTAAAEAETSWQSVDTCRVYACGLPPSPLAITPYDLGGSGTWGCNRPLDVLLLSLSPRVLVVEEFLLPEVCVALRDLATPRLTRSRVSTGTETPSRTSSGTFLTGSMAQHPLVLAMERAMEGLMSHPLVIGGKKGLIKTEALQVVAYRKGEFYAEHYDNKAGSNITRAATIIIYLCDTPSGGATLFSRAAGVPFRDINLSRVSLGDISGLSGALQQREDIPRPGLRIYPRMGRALLFWSSLNDGSEDLTSLHAAESVDAGEKWIATRWFKEVDDK